MFPETTRILIVDDMLTMRQLVKGQLKLMGFKFFFDADNGENGLKVLEHQHSTGEPIGLVLSDWNMPVMTGLDFLKAVRAKPHFKDLPFLMVTAEGEQSQVVDAIKSGVSNYLIKPFTPASIKEKVLAVWKKHHPAG
jgi:two-component system, chemotaxis family, chemotaxis protein CheY